MLTLKNNCLYHDTSTDLLLIQGLKGDTLEVLASPNTTIYAAAEIVVGVFSQKEVFSKLLKLYNTKHIHHINLCFRDRQILVSQSTLVQSIVLAYVT